MRRRAREPGAHARAPRILGRLPATCRRGRRYGSHGRPCVRAMEICHQQAALRGVVALGTEQPGGGVGEPPVVQTAGPSGESTLVAQQCDGHARLPQGLAQMVDHLRGSVLEPVEDAHHSRVDVIAAQHPSGNGVAGQSEEMIPFLQGQTQAAGEGGQHLLRRVGPSWLLESAVVVDRHVAQRGDFLSTQPAGPTAPPAWQPDVLRLQGLAPCSEEGRQLGSVHCCLCPRPSGPWRRPPPAWGLVAAYSGGSTPASAECTKTPQRARRFMIPSWGAGRLRPRLGPDA